MMFLSLIIILIIVIAIRKEKILNFSTFLLVSILYIICYGIVPLIIYTIDIPVGYEGTLGYLSYDPVTYEFLYYNASLLTLLSYIVFYVSYRIARFKPKALLSSYLLNDKTLDKLFKISKWLFILGTVFFVLYISIFGSIKNMLLANKRMAYGGNAEVEVESSFLFLIILAKLVIFSTYLLWGIRKVGNNKAKWYFYFSLIVALLLLFRFSGRLTLMSFIATFALSGFILKQRLPKLKFTLLIAGVGFVLLFGKSIFKSILYDDAFSRRQERYTGENSFSTTILDIFGSFSFPYNNIVFNLNNNTDFQFFIDILQFPLYILPSRIVPVKTVDTTIEVNTMNILGVKGGIIPPDIVTYGYLNLGLIGIVLVAMLFGILCKYIDSYQRKGASAISIIISVALIFIVGFSVMYFNPKQVTIGVFYFFTSLALLRFFKPRIKRFNFKNSN